MASPHQQEEETRGDALEALQAIASGIACRDAAAPEDLDAQLLKQIAELGLFPYEDWSLRHFPPELHHLCGKGMGIWQYPNQLLPLAILLQKYQVESYLEIGVAAGGTFTFMCELLASWAPPGAFRALGCDPAPPGCVSYLTKNPFQKRFADWLASSPAIAYKQEYSEFLERRWMRDKVPSFEYAEFLERRSEFSESFDCVFVDGDHSYEGCWADVQMALRLNAGIIILHDVVNAECPGVVDAWAEAQSTLKDEFIFFEFSEQYESVKRDPGERFLGIGVCVRKTMPKRLSPE